MLPAFDLKWDNDKGYEHMSKIKTLCKTERLQNPERFIKIFTNDHYVPGICINSECNYVKYVRKDERRGFCEKCGTYSVTSGLIFAGTIQII